MDPAQSMFVQLTHRPARKVILKRGWDAADYFAYCEEVGCDVWGLLMRMDALSGEPVCLWLPDQYRTPGTSRYVQGVEVPADYAGPVPEGFDVISLPASDYLLFQGAPFQEEDYCTAVLSVQRAMDRYDPAALGLYWDDSSPRIQLEPRSERGYIELRAVKKIL